MQKFVINFYANLFLQVRTHRIRIHYSDNSSKNLDYSNMLSFKMRCCALAILISMLYTSNYSTFILD